MAVGDVYELVCEQLYGTSHILNVFYYEQIAVVVPLAGEPIAAILAQQWDNQVGSVMRTYQSGDVVHVEVRCRNLFDDSDSGSVPSAAGGGSTSDDTTPPFVAASFKLFGDNPAVKNGAKRVVGIPEAYVSDGIITNAEYIGNLEDVADAFAKNVTAGSVILTDTWAPTIVKRIRSGTPGAYEYRLPENVGETTLSRVSRVLLSLVLSSQVSRKYGRGM